MTSRVKIEASQPIHGVTVDRDVYVAARDGVRLAVDIYRPDAPASSRPCWLSPRTAKTCRPAILRRSRSGSRCSRRR